MNKRHTPEYSSWAAMKQRCLNPRNKDFPRYAGTGVTISPRWIDNFDNFLKDMGPRPSGTTLDRWPDCKGNYEPGNCRWASFKDQQRNRSTCVYVEFGGLTLTVAGWAEHLSIHKRTLATRLKKMPVEDAFRKERRMGGPWGSKFSGVAL